MRSTLLFSILLMLLLSSCKGKESNSETTEPGASMATTMPSAYLAAEEALSGGKEAAEVSALMMTNFNAVSDANTGKLNLQASKDFVKLAQKLSDKFPGDTATAMPLYRSAEVVRAMNDPKRAATIYSTVYERYPTFSKSPEALFMLAFTYDEDLKDLDAALETYNKFLKNYPNHSFADDTEMLLKNLGKSDEDILKELEAKTKTQ